MQYLYLIKCQQYFKIGVANDVESRLAQLSTGNPFLLEVEIVYEFDNAEIVERVIHQKLKNKRVRGEWFELSYDDTTELHKLCLMLGGSAFEYAGENPNEDAIEEAEEIQKKALEGSNKWDFAAMFADGWQMQVQDSRGKYWIWRNRMNGKDKSMWGGTITNLPYPIETMRQIYRDGLQTPEAEAK